MELNCNPIRFANSRFGHIRPHNPNVLVGHFRNGRRSAESCTTTSHQVFGLTVRVIILYMTKMTEKNKSIPIVGVRPVPMKLFASWEVDRTPPNCIPRYVLVIQIGNKFTWSLTFQSSILVLKSRVLLWPVGTCTLNWLEKEFGDLPTLKSWS